ncbi:hypothetical protein FOZ60_004318 [Perkinsus olseni]|uniref:EF-hand domain-containing protein n=1 Tax=Perkinsus olseni TaxID=32597 RepID=A0A7J6NTA9_PEROL|nr:hypothetical protein FOZ60_004318 [Perkinsus olseni]
MLINRLLRSTIGRIGSTRGFAIYRTPVPAISGVLEVRQTLHISSGLAGLATAFDKLPKDSDGFTREELQRSSPSTSSETMDAIFELFDNFPKDGKISYNELCAYLLLHAEGVTEAERSEFTFSICDANGDNKVSKEELAGVVETLAYAKSKNWSEAKVRGPVAPTLAYFSP